MENASDDAARRIAVLDMLATEFAQGSVNRFTIGTGETVPVSYIQAQARTVFAGALYRLAPHVTADLLKPEAFELEAAFGIAVVKEFFETEQPELLPQYPSLAEWTFASSVARDGLRDYVRDWQRRHHLNDDWLHWAAMDTIHKTFVFTYRAEDEDFSKRFPDGVPLFLSDVDGMATLHDGKESRTRVEPAPVRLDHLKCSHDEGSDSVQEDDGEIGTFDPRTETIDAAVKRLMPELELRLRRRLVNIAAEDRDLNAAQPPMEFRKANAFEWLVRFQVLGESRKQIARTVAEARGNDDPQDYASYIGKEIRRVANIIGLTLRDA